MATEQGRFAPQQLSEIMGANIHHVAKQPLSATDSTSVTQLAGGVAAFLHDFEDGPMWDLFQQRDDVACEMLTWLIVATHRLGTVGLFPAWPVEPPVQRA
jgi:hypothetical protein